MQDLFTSQRKHYSNEEIKRRELFKLVESDLKNSLTNTNFELFDSLLKNLDISDRQKHFIASSLSLEILPFLTRSNKGLPETFVNLGNGTIVSP